MGALWQAGRLNTTLSVAGCNGDVRIVMFSFRILYAYTVILRCPKINLFF
ncbi:Hypothetical protein ETEE_3224 [Edwardsiella anguillarum ET080813]|uniref:Uncharacterized protein n=1 Tax=Edwardsiella anguillarum ET080813 TaxID=667120 RepID=A0A076LMD0_9GAMM|nr:Hypothetical protein ETEE_3224 [Edwardsiella anguillarum ET080813]